MNRIVLIQMLSKIRIFCNFKGFKQFIGIIPFSIICHQHICRHGFTKSSWSAHADILLFCTKNFVCFCDQFAFIYIYFRAKTSFKRKISRIQITAHANSSHQSFIEYIILDSLNNHKQFAYRTQLQESSNILAVKCASCNA